VNHRFPSAIFTPIAVLIVSAAMGLMAVTTQAANNRPFNLSVTTHLGDTQSFLEGDIVSFYISMDQDAYLTILYQDAGGQLSVLLPNSLYPDSFFRAGLFIPIPNEQNPYQFRITAPFGKETLWVFAADKPIPGITAESTPFSGSIQSVRSTFKNLCRQHHAACEESSLDIKTTATTPNQ
jgi:hypothetical protein